MLGTKMSFNSIYQMIVNLIFKFYEPFQLDPTCNLFISLILTEIRQTY